MHRYIRFYLESNYRLQYITSQMKSCLYPMLHLILSRAIEAIHRTRFYDPVQLHTYPLRQTEARTDQEKGLTEPKVRTFCVRHCVTL